MCNCSATVLIDWCGENNRACFHRVGEIKSSTSTLRIQEIIVAVAFIHLRLQGHRSPHPFSIDILVRPVTKVEADGGSMWDTRVRDNKRFIDSTLPKGDESRGYFVRNFWPP